MNPLIIFYYKSLSRPSRNAAISAHESSYTPTEFQDFHLRSFQREQPAVGEVIAEIQRDFTSLLNYLIMKLTEQDDERGYIDAAFSGSPFAYFIVFTFTILSVLLCCTVGGAWDLRFSST